MESAYFSSVAASALTRLTSLAAKLCGAAAISTSQKTYIEAVATPSTQLLAVFRGKDSWIARLGGVDLTAELAAFVQGYGVGNISCYMITPYGSRGLDLREAGRIASQDVCELCPTGKIKYRGVVLASMATYTIWLGNQMRSYECKLETSNKSNYLSTDRLLDLKSIAEQSIVDAANGFGDAVNLSSRSTIYLNDMNIDEVIAATKRIESSSLQAA